MATRPGEAEEEGGGGGGRRERASGSSAPSDPQKTEEAVNHRQNNCVKTVGTSPALVYSATAVSTAVRSRATRTGPYP